jgi:hypothetical protein
METEPLGPNDDPHLVYNPDQDPDEKRRVRGGYRALQAELEGARLLTLTFNRKLKSM